MTRGQLVEFRHQCAQELHGPWRAELLGQPDEALEVREQNGGLGERVGDGRIRSLLEAIDDRIRQDVA